MPAGRYFLEKPFIQGKTLLLETQEHHHLTTVMRASVQEEIELVNGLNQLAKATLTQINKKNAEVCIESVETKDPSPSLILAQALPRLPRLDYIIEKGTELGATEFWLFPSQNSEKKDLSPTQYARLRHLTIAAMKQCGRWDLPSILIKESFLKTPWNLKNTQAFYGDTRSNAPHFSTLKPSDPLIFFIGPESGFHPKETDFLENHAQGVQLHRNILRTDTAALTALALASSALHLHPRHHLP